MGIAFVITRCPMLNLRSTVAVVPTPSELGVERLQDLSIDPAHLHGAENRSDVLTDVTLVAGLCVRSNIEQLEVPIEELIDGGRSPRVSLLVNLIEQADQCPLSISLGLPPGGNGLDEIATLLR